MKDAPEMEDVLVICEGGWHSIAWLENGTHPCQHPIGWTCRATRLPLASAPIGWLPLPNPITGFAPVVTEELVQNILRSLQGVPVGAGDGDTVVPIAPTPGSVRQALKDNLPYAKTEAQVKEALIERCAVLLEAYHNDVAADILRAQKGKSDG
jgi:hypothetical protein